MYYGQIKNCDIANGEGVRVTLFVSGCTNRCEGCFQPETWDFCYGKHFTEATEAEIIEMLRPGYIKGLTLLGGEPFEPENQRDLVDFIEKVKKLYPEKNLWAFSGFTLEELLRDGSYPRCEVTDRMLAQIDVLVDGRFIQSQKDITLKFRGSKNQRVLNLSASLKEGRAVLLYK